MEKITFKYFPEGIFSVKLNTEQYPVPEKKYVDSLGQKNEDKDSVFPQDVNNDIEQILHDNESSRDKIIKLILPNSLDGPIPSEGQSDLFVYLCQNTGLKYFKYELEIVFLEEIILHNRDMLYKVLENDLPKILIGTIDILNQQHLSSSVHLKALNEVDNNIWIHYVKLNDEQKFNKEFNDKLDLINEYCSKGYYDLIISSEYMSTYRTIVRENKIDGFSGHASQVLPFVLTSETIFKERTIKSIAKINKIIIDQMRVSHLEDRKVEWKILLIDDYSEKELRPLHKSKSPKLNKNNILDKVLKVITDSCRYISFIVEYAISLEEGLSKISDATYDIILVDYLFSREDEKKPPSYGTDILIELSKDETLKYKRGPFDKFWIIPISVFSNAFIDDMRNQGVDFVNEKWELSRGADFINTPYLFSSFFTGILANQLEKAMNVKNIVNKVYDANILNLTTKVPVETYTDYYKYRDDITSFVDDEDSLFIKSIKLDIESSSNSHEGKNIFDYLKSGSDLYHFENLLYNRTYKNYPGNEEIILLFDLINQKR